MSPFSTMLAETTLGSRMTDARLGRSWGSFEFEGRGKAELPSSFGLVSILVL